MLERDDRWAVCRDSEVEQGEWQTKQSEQMPEQHDGNRIYRDSGHPTPITTQLR